MSRMTWPSKLLLPLLAATAAACGSSDNTPVVATVTVSPDLSTVMTVGATLQYSAAAKDADGGTISGKDFTWTSSQIGVATISSPGGLATVVGEGTTTITGSTDGVNGTATLVVEVPGTIQGTVTLDNGVATRTNEIRRRASGTRSDRPSISLAPKPNLGPTSPVRPRPRAGVPVSERSVPGEWIVTFSPRALGVPAAGSLAYTAGATARRASTEIRAALASLERGGKATVTQVSPAILAARVRVGPGVSAASVASELRSNPSVVAVEPNLIRHAFGHTSGAPAPLPNDPLLPFQAWHYSMIDLPRAWQITTGSASVLVAVVDNGIRFDHPGIAANLTNDGYDFVSNTSVTVCGGGSTGNAGDGNGYDSDPTNPLDVFVDDVHDCVTGTKTSGDHGLHVAGTIGAPGNDGLGGTGVNWNVRIRPVRVLGLDGGTVFDIAQGILYAAGLPADNGHNDGGTVTAPSRAAIINLSLGGPTPTTVEHDAVIAANAAGSLVVAAAGNDASADPRYPGAFPEVLSVSAVGPDGKLATYSSFGSTVDIAAPGGDFVDGAVAGGNFAQGDRTFDVLSTVWNYETSQPIYDNLRWEGTSMAAPHVSGVAALILASHPGLTNAQLRARLETYAVDIGTPGQDNSFGHGLVNAYNALTETFGPPRSLRVFLYNAATGALVSSAATGPGGSYQFTGLADGTYRVYAGEDESSDAVFGRALKRWGAFGGTGTPTVITVAGSGVTTADFTVGLPGELEDNNSLQNADILPVGGYLIGFFGNPATDVDLTRVDVATAGQYTFETSPLAGACGFALEEDTILELLSSNGTQMDLNDDIDAEAFNFCSRITASLSPGTYYLRTSAFTGTSASGLGNRRYTISARSGP
jgi:subtilisin family serine protease